MSIPENIQIACRGIGMGTLTWVTARSDRRCAECRNVAVKDGELYVRDEGRYEGYQHQTLCVPCAWGLYGPSGSAEAWRGNDRAHICGPGHLVDGTSREWRIAQEAQIAHQRKAMQTYWRRLDRLSE